MLKLFSINGEIDGTMHRERGGYLDALDDYGVTIVVCKPILV
jgi:hypothetical protein